MSEIAVKIENVQLLKMETLKSLPKNIIKKLHVELADEDDDSLLEHDFVQWIVSISDNKYNFYHGFPGDNPMGVLVDIDNTEVLAVVGEGGSDAIDEKNEAALAFVAYYDEVTEEACNFEMKEFRVSEIGNLDEETKMTKKSRDDSDNENNENEESDADSDKQQSKKVKV